MLFVENRLVALRVWCQGRPYRLLWRLLPVVMAGAVLAGILLALLLRRESSPIVVDQQYSACVDHALATHDFETARVACLRRMALGRAPKAEIMMQLSQALRGLGHEQDARALLEVLAPPGRPGYEPAHLALAQHFLSQPPLAAPALKQAELHLAPVLEANPQSETAKALLKSLHDRLRTWESGQTNDLALDPNSLTTHEIAGWVYFQMQDWPAAKPHLLAEVGSNPSVDFMLARMAQAQGDESGRNKWTAKAEAFYRAQVEAAHPDDPGGRVAWMEANVLQGQFDEALKVIGTGEKLSGTNLYRPAKAWLYGVWAEAVAPDAAVNGAHAAALEEMRVQLEAWSRLQDPAAKVAAEALARLAKKSEATPQVYARMGMEAWQKGDLESARDLFNHACDLAPGQPVLANNLALLLALVPDPDLNRALKISQTLVDQFPDQPNFRDTHGQILVRLGRWQEAVKDLEFALPKLTNQRATHLALACAYRNLNRFNEASQQEQLARGTSGIPSAIRSTN